MLHIVARKLAKRHHSTIRISLALLILQKSPPTSIRLLSKQLGSAAQYDSTFAFVHLAHVVCEKEIDRLVHFATQVSISASGHSEMVSLVNDIFLQAISDVVEYNFTYCTLLSI